MGYSIYLLKFPKRCLERPTTMSKSTRNDQGNGNGTQGNGKGTRKRLRRLGPRWLATGLTAGLLAGAGLIAWWKLPHARRNLGGPGDATADRGRDRNGNRIACVFIPGTELAYDLSITTDVQIDIARLNLPPGAVINGPPPRRATAATLALRVLAPADDDQASRGAVLLARFATIDAQTTQDAGDLTPPFVLRVAPSCQIVDFGRLDTTGPAEGRTQQALAHELQWMLPAGPRALANGSNSFGKFRALFERNERTAALAVDRRIEVYNEVWGRDPRLGFAAPPGGSAPTVSTQHVELGAGPWFEKLDAREQLVGLSVADTDSRTSATRVQMPEQALADAPTALGRYVWEDLLSRSMATLGQATSGGKRAAERMALRKLPFQQAVDQFLARVKAGENISKLWPELARYIEARPEMASRLAGMLRRLELPPAARGPAFLALGKANVPEARDALWKMKDDGAARTIDRARSAFAMVDRADVGVDLAESLRKDSQPVASGGDRDSRIFAREAALALGMMGGLKAESDPAVTTIASESATDLLRAGHDATTLSPAFAVIANIGDPALLAKVTPYTQNTDPGIRAAAAVATRRMPPAETADMTATWLARETDAEVKRAVYHTVAMQTHDAQTIADARIIDQAILDLAAQPSVLTRQSLIEILGKACKTSPAAKAALIRQVKVEAHLGQGLLKQIGMYLDGAEMAQGINGQ